MILSIAQFSNVFVLHFANAPGTQSHPKSKNKPFNTDGKGRQQIIINKESILNYSSVVFIGKKTHRSDMYIYISIYVYT